MADLIVSIVDDDTERHPTLVAKWTEVCRAGGLEPRISCFSDFDDPAGIFFNRPHLVIVDNVLIDRATGKENVNRGIDFVAQHKFAFQDALFLLSTRETFSIEVLGNKFPNPDLVYPKTCLSSQVFQAYLGERLRHLIKRSSFKDLIFPLPKDAQATNHCRNEIKSIVEQCIHGISGAKDQPSIEQINLYGLGGGYSGAFVFRVEMFSRDYRRNIPLVLKVTQGGHSGKEALNFNAFARLQMPNEMRVDMIGVGEAGEFSGALYAFAFGGAEGIIPAASAIEQGDYSVISKVFELVFEANAVGWYREPIVRTDAEDFFSNSLEYSPQKDGRRISGLQSYAEAHLSDLSFEISLDKVRIGKFGANFIRRQLHKFDRVSVPECVCHGDFNTNNIIFNEDRSSLSIIDFEYTGLDCFFKDFISLEASLRINEHGVAIESSKDFQACAQAEKQILDGVDISRLPRSAEKFVAYFQQLQKVRQAAHRACERVDLKFDSQLYSLGLAFHLLKLLGIPGWSRESSLFLMASFIATSCYLEES